MNHLATSHHHSSPARGSLLQQALMTGLGLITLVLTANFKIPLQPVPISLQLLAVMLIGLFMPLRTVAVCVGLYTLAAFAFGQPIAAGNTLFTGGYLIGYLVAATFTAVLWSWAKERSSRFEQVVLTATGVTGGVVMVHLLGFLWGHVVMSSIHPQQTFGMTFATFTLPFLGIDLLKGVIAGLAALAVNLRR